MEFQGSGDGHRLKAQKRECDSQMTFHAGRALELSMQIIYARSNDRIMGRGYPGVTATQLKDDLRGGHSLLKLYNKIVRESDNPNLDKAFEDKYQYALHKGITDIYLDERLLVSIFLQSESPFLERSDSRIADGEESTMDHSPIQELFSHPDGTSDFAQMPYDTFEKFLSKADAVYYEGDTPGKGKRRNMRWANYTARDHESGRPYVTIGEYFFARLVQNIIQLSHEPWTWHKDFLDHFIIRHKYNIMKRMEILAEQHLKDEVLWPEMISDDKMKKSLLFLPENPEIGKGSYDHLHTRLLYHTRPSI